MVGKDATKNKARLYWGVKDTYSYIIIINTNKLS